jgi:hypothetical protein
LPGGGVVGSSEVGNISQVLPFVFILAVPLMTGDS